MNSCPVAEVTDSTTMCSRAVESARMNAKEVKNSPDWYRFTAVMSMDQMFTPSIIWYWSMWYCLNTLLCHCEVNESHTRYRAKRDTPKEESWCVLSKGASRSKKVNRETLRVMRVASMYSMWG